jgi:hypothetical protein
MEDMIIVVLSNGRMARFINVNPPEIDSSGRLYISEEGRDVAVFAAGGWSMFCRPQQNVDMSEFDETEE